MKQLTILASLFLASVAAAGDFEVTGCDETSVSVWYTGEVLRDDYLKWAEIEAIAGDRTIVLTIDSYGGSAFGGFDLYWAIERAKVITVGGNWRGAWSAAAIMWMAGDYRCVLPGGAVGWHRAYCTWDDQPMPDIGCDVSVCDDEMTRIFDDAGYNGNLFTWTLQDIQWECGTDGWITVTNDGWFFDDDSDRTRIKVAPGDFGVPVEDWSVTP